jgi:putative hydrolase of the HAD superfamily
MDLFDFVADSSELGMRKPAPGIYQRTLEELGVRAERSIFVDDAPGNVSAAADLGITSLLVGHSETEAAAVAEELLRLTAVEL